MLRKSVLVAYQTARLWLLTKLMAMEEPQIWRRSLENQHQTWQISSSRGPRPKYASKLALGQDPKLCASTQHTSLQISQMRPSDKQSQVSLDNPSRCQKWVRRRTRLSGRQNRWKDGLKMFIKSQITSIVVIRLASRASRSLTGFRPCAIRWQSPRLRASTTKAPSYQGVCSNLISKTSLKCQTTWPTRFSNKMSKV